MSRAEIRKKFDEIVAFAEVEKFLDTPVKRYSLGMYVRLAFAVAAHLEPEILVVDEVLAVGDAEFQKKCLGKMNDVSRRDGRTVLFVSHNLAAIQQLCKSCIALQSGKIFQTGLPLNVLNTYLARGQTVKGTFNLSNITEREGTGCIRFERITLADKQGQIIDRPKTGQTLAILVTFSKDSTPKPARVSVAFATVSGTTLFACDTQTAGAQLIQIGSHDTLRLLIPELPLAAGTYQLRLFLERRGMIKDWIKYDLELEVDDADFFGSGRNTPKGWRGGRSGSTLLAAACRRGGPPDLII